MTGAVAELALRPGLHSSRYNEHVKRVLGLGGESETVQHIETPISDVTDGSRTTFKMPVIPPHEELNKEMSEHPELATKLQKMVDEDELPDIVTQHPVFRSSGGKAQPIAIYVDGVPTTSRDGVIGFWFYFMLSEKRHLVCTQLKSKLCKCGCRGWCTLFVLLLWMHWSVSAMALGENPYVDFIGQPFTDPIRLALVGKKLLFIGAVCAIKGDWSEFCQTFAFANWRTNLSPCLHCWATKANYLDDSTFGMDSQVWDPFTMDDYNEACRQSEIHVLVETMAVLNRIRSNLFF